MLLLKSTATSYLLFLLDYLLWQKPAAMSRGHSSSSTRRPTWKGTGPAANNQRGTTRWGSSLGSDLAALSNTPSSGHGLCHFPGTPHWHGLGKIPLPCMKTPFPFAPRTSVKYRRTSESWNRQIYAPLTAWSCYKVETFTYLPLCKVTKRFILSKRGMIPL